MSTEEFEEKAKNDYKMNDLMIMEKINQILMEDQKPSIRLNQLSETKEFKESSFQILNRMKDTEQSKQHHPEGNVWIHTMMVVDEAANVKKDSIDPQVFLWAAFLHDMGKPDVTKLRKGKITAYNHDKVGAVAAEELLDQVSKNPTWNQKVVAMVRWHMQILFVAKNMAFADIETMKQEVDLNEVALLGMCDRLGRLGVNRNEVMEDIKTFRNKVLNEK